MDREPETRPESETRPVERSVIGYSTSPALATGGALKSAAEDFVVEEIPAYLPSGLGEHLYLWIEKRDVSAEVLLDRLARGLNIPRGEIGTAGLKDRRAVTRQWVSVPARVESAASTLAIEGVTILETARHGNKLRTGHLRGNRFEIRLREVGASAADAAPAIADQLRAAGVPNLYGDQRFGVDGQTLTLGLALLRGERSPRSIPHPRRKFLLRLALSAVQSALFNESLAERLRAGTLWQVQAGDVMQVTASGGLFVAEDVAVEQSRCARRETAITGPMFGPRMRAPAGEVAAAEAEVLARWGLEPTAFERFGDLTAGTRRPYVVPATDLEAALDGDSLVLRFSLPAGAYATSVVREFQKGETRFSPEA
jgi:tRNA pseudouridine13 synthase